MRLPGDEVRFFKLLLLFSLAINLALHSGARAIPPLNVMAPLTIGDVHFPQAPHSINSWTQFKTDLNKIRALGAEAITVDIWWGLVEKVEGQYDWSYYDKLLEAIEAAGLKFVPILSFHQLGGNVGDQGFLPPPSWIWEKYIGVGGIKDINSLKYKSEQGNYNAEYVSVWGTPYVVSDYKRFMLEFQAHFSSKSHLIQEINISLGAAGELRYPSYNSHDVGTGYKTRGALQSYSDLAVNSFREFIKKRYTDLRTLNARWQTTLQSFEEVYPPSPSTLQSGFFVDGEHFSPYGKDFFDWYNESLLNHGETLLTTALEVFDSPLSAMKGVDIGAKIPGVHWRVATDRLAELSAGLIRTSYNDWYSPISDHGYADTLALFQKLNEQATESRIVLHFTALEMDDGRDGAEVGSRAKSLVNWMGASAHKRNIPIKGENALAEELGSPQAWENIRNALSNSHYQGFTVLRLNSLLQNPYSAEAFKDLRCHLLLNSSGETSF